MRVDPDIEALDTSAQAWRIEVDQYYSRDGFPRLEITQPLGPLRTFHALLAYDSGEISAKG